MTETAPPLHEAFQQFFEVIPANTDELRDIVYRIRYQVYCHEMHFEKEEDYPDGREIDEFDNQSVHCLLKHRGSGEYAGCVRLVLNHSDRREPQLPLEHHCGESLNKTVLDLSEFDRRTFGEISRLAITSRFRRRKGEAQTPHGVSEEDLEISPSERRIFPHIAVGLYLAAAAMSLQRDMKMVLVMMEPRLARHMKYFGINFIQAGDIIDHHGMRGPFYSIVEKNLRAIRPEIEKLLAVISDQLTTSPKAKLADEA